MTPPCPLYWLRGAGFTVRRWITTHWGIMHPATRPISILTLAELRTLVRILERDLRPLIIAVGDGSTPN